MYYQAIDIQDLFSPFRLKFAYGSDTSIPQPNIGWPVKPERWINDMSATEQGCASHDEMVHAEKNRLAAPCGPGDGVAAESGLMVCATRSLC